MRVEDRVRLLHIIDAAQSAISFVTGRQRGELESDRMLQFALVRAIEILGEAAAKVTIETRNAAAAIPWKAIIGMRNRLIHAYFEIDAEILWVAATIELPKLLVQLQTLDEVAE